MAQHEIQSKNHKKPNRTTPHYRNGVEGSLRHAQGKYVARETTQPPCGRTTAGACLRATGQTEQGRPNRESGAVTGSGTRRIWKAPERHANSSKRARTACGAAIRGRKVWSERSRCSLNAKDGWFFGRNPKAGSLRGDQQTQSLQRTHVFARGGLHDAPARRTSVTRSPGYQTSANARASGLGNRL